MEQNGVIAYSFAGTTSTANAVNVVLDSEREGIVDNIFYVGDIKSTSSNISKAKMMTRLAFDE
jgi:hypothetical protein